MFDGYEAHGNPTKNLVFLCNLIQSETTVTDNAKPIFNHISRYQHIHKPTLSAPLLSLTPTHIHIHSHRLARMSCIYLSANGVFLLLLWTTL